MNDSSSEEGWDGGQGRDEGLSVKERSSAGDDGREGQGDSLPPNGVSGK
jgi:hypothetical protein